MSGDNLTRILDLIDRFGIALIGLVAFGIVIVVLARYIRALHQAQLVLLQSEVEYERRLREDEKKLRQEAEARLASNSDALKEATVGFEAAIHLMERLARRSIQPFEGRDATET
jgi:predicted Holliday junction resolvase-like endonuclease